MKITTGAVGVIRINENTAKLRPERILMIKRTLLNEV